MTWVAGRRHMEREVVRLRDLRRWDARRAVLVRSALLAAMLIGTFGSLAWAAGPLPPVGVFGDAAREGGFAQVLEPRGFEFPRDHGPQPE